MTDLLELMASGRRNLEALSDPTALTAAASQVGNFASAHGFTYLVAASAAAERIVGAALVLLSQGQAFPQHPPVDENLPVLLVDVNLASGTVLAEAARRARQQGASRVEGLVLHALCDAVGPQECGLDNLEILERPEAVKAAW